MTFPWTAKQLADKARELALKAPDNRYLKGGTEPIDGCKYNSGACTDGSVGCIFGQAALALGCAIPDEGYAEDTSIANIVCTNLLVCRCPIVRWMELVQQDQDDGYSWGDAIKRADASVFLEWEKEVQA